MPTPPLRVPTVTPTTIILYAPEPDPHVIRLRPVPGAISVWQAASAISLQGYGSLFAGANFRAAATIAVGTTARLNQKPVLAAAATVTVGTDAHLPLANPLAAAATVHVETVAPLTTYAMLRAAPQLRVLTTPPRLDAPGPLRAQAQIQLRTNVPRLSRVAQFFTAQSRITVGTTANLRVVGQSATDVFITFNGAPTFNVRLGSITIDDVLNESPNSCHFIVDQRIGQPGPPSVGTDVRIGLRDAAVNNLLFAGTVKTLEPYYELTPKNPAWEVTCEDYTFLLNRRRVFGTWTNVSATSVALEILSKFTAGFSTAGIAAGLPAITMSFRGETVMDALTQIANAVGGYAGGPDYNRVVWLFLTDPRLAPDPVTAAHPLLMLQPAVRQQLDLSQVRTRVDVQGAGTDVAGPTNFSISGEFGQLPVEDSHLFTLGAATSSQVITRNNQILTYTGVLPGKLTTLVKGNVAPPPAAPTASIAPTVAGELNGRYLWKVSFANENGETEVGPPTFPVLQCNPFPAPTTALGLSAANTQRGPLVGAYDYAVTFVTSKGETLPGPRTSRTASATPPPTSLFAQEYAHAGRLQSGATYRYQVSYTTIYGETAPYGPVLYTPSALGWPSLSNFQQFIFGGLTENADYTYGISFVTAVGEGPIATVRLRSLFTGTPGNPTFTGYFDAQGRIVPGQYAWACSFYHDQFGESPLGPQLINNPSGTLPPGAVGLRIELNLPGVPSRADGLRLYRGFAGGNPWALVADFRRGNTPSRYLDYIAQTECGNPWPISQRRVGGIAMQMDVGPTSEPDVVARRIYRSKANGSELFLLAEIQNNLSTVYLDTAFDEALQARNPVAATTGRQALLTLPQAFTTGYVGRRVYRTKGNNTVYYRIADLKEMTTATIIDNTPDDALTGEGPANPSTAGGEAHLLQSIPKGPTGTLARRLYRTVAGGVELRLLVEIADNVTETYLDTVPDDNLGHNLAPLVAKAGAAAVLLQNVPRGGPSITKRFIYRTKALAPDGGGSTDFYYVGAITNNTDTTFTDTKGDDDLGRPPVATSTIGALAGDTSLVVTSAAGWPPSGWFDADSQTIRYEGITFSGDPTRGDTLTGIPPLLTVSSLTRSGQIATAITAAPHGFTAGHRIVVLGADQPEYNGTRTIDTVPNATVFTYVVDGKPVSPATFPVGKPIVTSAPGAISAAIAGGTACVSVPMLTGVTGIGTPIPVGESVNLWVVRNGVPAQQAIAQLEGGDGIHEYMIDDTSLDSIAACAARGDAELLAFQSVGVSITYTTRDRKTRSGALVSINLPTPTIAGSFRISSVRIDQIDLAARLYPRYAVTCSSTKFSILDVLRHLVLAGAA